MPDGEKTKIYYYVKVKELISDIALGLKLCFGSRTQTVDSWLKQVHKDLRQTQKGDLWWKELKATGIASWSKVLHF